MARLDRKRSRGPGKATEAPASVGRSDGGDEGSSPEIDGPGEDQEVGAHVVRLTTGQLRQLIEGLGGSAEDEDSLVDSLLALLAGYA